MADGFGYGGFSGASYPFWISSPSQHPSASAPPFLPSYPVDSYNDPPQGGFDPMFSHGSYHRSQADSSNNPSYLENSSSQIPSSSFYADNSRLGNSGHKGDNSYRDMFSPSGVYSSKESSSDFVTLPTENFSEKLPFYYAPAYNSSTTAPVSSSAELLIRNSQEPFFVMPVAPSDFYASSNTLDEKRPEYYYVGDDKSESTNVVPSPLTEPYIYAPHSVPSLPMSSLKTQPLFDGNQTGIHLGDGRSFNGDVCNHVPENFVGVQSGLRGSSIDPVNFDVLLGYGEATGQVKPLSVNPDFPYQIVDSPGSKGPQSPHPLQFYISSSGSPFMVKQEGSGVSSLYQRPDNLVVDSANGVSESSLKNAVEDLNSDKHRSWNYFMVSSEGPSAPTMFSMGSGSCRPVKADNENDQSAVNYSYASKGSANQPSEHVQANQKPYKPPEQMFDTMNRDKKTTLLTDMGIKGSNRSNADDVSTGHSPERYICDQGDSPSPTASQRVSSVINAMHNLSEVLVYECFNNGSSLKMEQLENLDKVVDNLTKCLKKITGNKTIAREASLPTEAMHVSSQNVVKLNEASKVVAKEFQGFNVKPLDNFGLKEQVDKTEMTQSIKNVLAFNFPDGEENHPRSLLYKNLWLETEAALFSTTCMARYHRIKNEIGNLNLQNKEVSADEPNSMQEPLLNPQKSVPMMNNVEHETTGSLFKERSNIGNNNVVTMSDDAPQSSIINPDPLDAVLSLMSRSFTSTLEPNILGNFKPDATFGKIPDVKQQESSASITENKHRDVIDRFQILKHQETNRKLKTQNCTENNPEALEIAKIGISRDASDVMDRLQILKRREAEQAKRSVNSLNIDSDSDKDKPRSKTQMHDGDLLGSASMAKTRLWGTNSEMETCVVDDDDDDEPSASGKGYESPTSDWEHVRNDD
ncbi:unnamed protein product [Cochlearia groenlandica]